MRKVEKLADFNHPIVMKKAKDLSKGAVSDRERLEKFFYYVRDEIKFGFPSKGDLMKASETIKLGMGQCNTKATLILALCKAVGIPARVHFSLITRDIQRGIFTGWRFKILPKFLSHDWVEVKIEGKWRKIDSFINDINMYIVGKQLLREKEWDIGYSIACTSGESSADYNIDEEKFVQMDAITDDHGIYDDPSEYYSSELYQNRPNPITLMIYRLMIGKLNRKIQTLRKSCTGELCIPCS